MTRTYNYLLNSSEWPIANNSSCESSPITPRKVLSHYELSQQRNSPQHTTIDSSPFLFLPKTVEIYYYEVFLFLVFFSILWMMSTKF